MRYSQNKEQDYIVNYFSGVVGNLLDIGANDGKTFSNSLALIELGWKATLVEPSPSAFKKLKELHKGNKNVKLINKAVSDKTGTITLHDMGEHVGAGDSSLLATTVEAEKDRWIGTEFKAIEVKAIPYWTIADNYALITIDAEGADIVILQQIDLSNVKMVCVEWNNKPELAEAFRAIVPREMKEIYRSLENIIYAR